MGESAFDTLRVAKELEETYGFQTKQAEGTAVMMHRHLVGNVATKDDLGRAVNDLTGKIDVLEERVILKMTVRLGGIMVAIFAFFEVLNRVFPIAGG